MLSFAYFLVQRKVQLWGKEMKIMSNISKSAHKDSGSKANKILLNLLVLAFSKSMNYF
jgi:hypothetical protein